MGALAVAQQTKSLEQLEAEIRDLVANRFEEFYELGIRLEAIKRGKFREAGSKTWNAYCKSGRLTLCSSRAHAETLIKTAGIRPHLVEVVSNTDNFSWTEWTVQPLTKLSPSRAKAVSKKLRAHVRSTGEKPTARMVQYFVDQETGAPQKRRAKQRKLLAATSKPHEVLNEWRATVVLWLQSCKRWPGEAWDDAEDLESGSAQRLAETLEELASYLRS